MADGQDGLWLTMFKGVNLLTAIVDTDYDNWAVFMQCMQEGGKNRFLSTRIMSRQPSLAPEHGLLAKETIKVKLLRKLMIIIMMMTRLVIWRVITNIRLTKKTAKQRNEENYELLVSSQASQLT